MSEKDDKSKVGRRGMLAWLGLAAAAPLLPGGQAGKAAVSAATAVAGAAIQAARPKETAEARAARELLAKVRDLEPIEAEGLSIEDQTPDPDAYPWRLRDDFDEIVRDRGEADAEAVYARLTPKLCAFYRQTIGDFRGYYANLQTFFGTDEGVKDLGADVKTIELLKKQSDALEVQKPHAETIGGAVWEAHQQYEKAIADKFEELRQKLDQPDIESLLRVSQNYQVIIPSYSYLFSDGNVDPVERLLIEKIHSSLYPFLEESAKFGGQGKVIFDEIFNQFADAVFAGVGRSPHGPYSFRHCRLSYDDYTPEIPNFFASLANRAQIESYYERNMTMPIGMLHRNSMWGYEKDTGLKYDIMGTGQPRVPVIRGLGGYERGAYYLTSGKRLGIPTGAEYEKEVAEKIAARIDRFAPEKMELIHRTLDEFAGTEPLPQALQEFLAGALRKYVWNQAEPVWQAAMQEAETQEMASTPTAPDAAHKKEEPLRLVNSSTAALQNGLSIPTQGDEAYIG